MARKKPKKRGKTKSSGSTSRRSVQERFNLAWSNFSMFFILFIISFLLYSFSTSALLRNFFGILSTILGFLSFAFLIVLIILGIAKSGKKKRR